MKIFWTLIALILIGFAVALFVILSDKRQKHVDAAAFCEVRGMRTYYTHGLGHVCADKNGTIYLLKAMQDAVDGR